MKNIQHKNFAYKFIYYGELCLVIFPILLSIFLIAKYGVNVPRVDDWAIMSIHETISNNGFHLKFFWQWHNEHRCFFPKLLLYSLSLITNWNVKAGMYTVVILFTGVCGLHLAYLKTTFTNLGKTNNFLSYIPISLITFSFRQFENFFWGWQVTFAMVAFFVVLSIFLVQKYIINNKIIYILFSILCAIIASYSSAQGLIVWPCLIIICIYEILCMRKLKYLLTLILLVFTFSLVAGIYIGMGIPDIFSTGKLFLFFPFVIIFIGSSIANEVSLAFFIGVLICIILLIELFLLFKNRRIRYNYYPIALILFGGGTGFVIAKGRLSFGLDQALSSRYTTFSIFILVGLYMIAFDLYISWLSNNEEMKMKLNKNYFLHLLTVINIIIFIISLCNYNFKSYKSTYQELQYALQNYKDFSPQNLYIQSLGGTISNYSLMESLGGGVFSQEKEDEVPDAILSGTPTDRDSIIGFGPDCITIEEGKYLFVSGGWSIDSVAEDVADSVYLRIGDQLFKTFYGRDRPDVGKALGLSKYNYSGFFISIPLDKINSDEFTIITLSRDKKYFYETQKFKIYP